MRPIPRRRALLALGAAATAAVVPASASSLGELASSPLGAGSASVLACDADGFTVTYTTSGGQVTHVTVEDVADPGCEAGTVRVTLVDGSDGAVASGGPATLAADGDTDPNSIQLAVSPQPDATTVQAAHVSVTGP